MSERQKFNVYTRRAVNCYFWRTHAQQEIDYIEESGGRLNAIEFKWNEKANVKFPDSFAQAYPGSAFASVNRENYFEFLVNSDSGSDSER